MTTHSGRIVKIVAHRGASKAEPENTIRAFRTAGQMGADAVELDVRRTRDGVLVVHHDPHLPDGRVIIDTDRADLGPSVPTLGEALDACAGMWVNVEVKNDPTEPDFDPADAIADDTMAALIDRGEPERWLISSFRLETIDRCRSIADAAAVPIRTAWLTTVVRRRRVAPHESRPRGAAPMGRAAAARGARRVSSGRPAGERVDL